MDAAALRESRRHPEDGGSRHAHRCDRPGRGSEITEKVSGVLDNLFDTARETALVTGAGNGIGRAIAQALVGEGVRTVFADVNGETVAAAIKASVRPDLAVPWVGDLADAAAREALLADATGALGRVTHFVHSASPPRKEADHA